jgi:hypothetical protein
MVLCYPGLPCMSMIGPFHSFALRISFSRSVLSPPALPRRSDIAEPFSKLSRPVLACRAVPNLSHYSASVRSSPRCPRLPYLDCHAPSILSNETPVPDSPILASAVRACQSVNTKPSPSTPNLLHSSALNSAPALLILPSSRALSRLGFCFRNFAFKCYCVCQ